MRKSMIVGAFILLGGCSTHSGGVVWRSDPDVVVVSDRGERGKGEREKGNRGKGEVYGRSVRVPPGHYPPPGRCRIWYVGVPPGRQPPASDCGKLVRRVPRGAFLLYNGRAWDTEYDWRSHERRHAGTVPDVVLQIMVTLVR